MISGSKLDVIWSPVHSDKFILWGSDITSYEVAPLKDIEKKSTCVKISSTHGATAVSSMSAGGVRCVDASWMSGAAEPLLALGHSSGRVSLTSLAPPQHAQDALSLAVREFVPRYPRLCNSVSWSPAESNLLAAAMDKHRSDHCIVLWDVNRAAASPTALTPSDGSTPTPAADQPKPLAEMGLSETAHSVHWTHDSNRTLIASMNMRFIKIFDLRDLSNKAVSVVTTRHCYGVVADPSQPWQLASRGDCVLCVWDTRRLDQPLLTLQQPRPISKILWCPTRRNLLCSLQRDASALRLHDIQQAHNVSKGTAADSTMAATSATAEAEGEAAIARGGPAVLERDVSPGNAPLAGFSWHWSLQARLLCVALSGQPIDYTVCERVTLCWGGGGGLVWAGGGAGGGLRSLPDALYTHLDDISLVIRRRALTDYGLKPDLWQNADLADDDQLAVLWHFLALSRSLVEDGCIRGGGWRHPGVLSVVCEAAAGYRSEMLHSLLPDLPNRRITIYKSSERAAALQLCGWGWGWEQAGAGVERAEEQGEWARAAALAAFHLRLRQALDVLQRAPHPTLRLAALALAGLGDERLWREALPAAAAALSDPYLRALLHFLSATAAAAPATGPQHAPQLDLVLSETDMRLEDRVAFACIFLSDAKLHEYLRGLSATLVAQGNLSGILLTGMSVAGVSLLQRWLEGTGDVQSAALLAARCLPHDLLQDPAVDNWLNSYRSLLDSWKLWWARCALDTWVSAAGGCASAARQVCVACGYCGKSVAAPPGHARPRHAAARMTPPAAKMKQISSCPNCRKPLPRCAVCLLHLGTAAGGVGGGAGAGAGAGAGGGAGASFAGWFTWCVACRHGGHATHLLSWFKDHTECPVSSCSCRCSTLDPPDRL